MPEIDINDAGAIRRRITELQRGEFHDRTFFEETYGLTRGALEGLLPLMAQHAERSPIDTDLLARIQAKIPKAA
jgi:hypothetical protein